VHRPYTVLLAGSASRWGSRAPRTASLTADRSDALQRRTGALSGSSVTAAGDVNGDGIKRRGRGKRRGNRLRQAAHVHDGAGGSAARDRPDRGGADVTAPGCAVITPKRCKGTARHCGTVRAGRAAWRTSRGNGHGRRNRHPASQRRGQRDDAPGQPLRRAREPRASRGSPAARSPATYRRPSPPPAHGPCVCSVSRSARSMSAFRARDVAGNLQATPVSRNPAPHGLSFRGSYPRSMRPVLGNADVLRELEPSGGSWRPRG